MDYDHYSASVCDFADADQDRWNSHVLPTPAATTPPTTAAAMPAALLLRGSSGAASVGEG